MSERAILVLNPRPFLNHLAATVELTAARSVLRKIVTLADQAPGLTDEQLRFRLLALAEYATPAHPLSPDPRLVVARGPRLRFRRPAGPISAADGEYARKVSAGMSEPLVCIGDPWIDAYLTFRRAWLDGATETELTDLAIECRHDLPSPVPPVPAAMFIHSDIMITAGQKALSTRLVTALWVPDGAGIAR